MEKDNSFLLIDESEFKEVLKVRKRIFDQIEKLNEKNPSMALLFATSLSEYANGYIDSFLERNNIPKETWQAIIDKVGNWDIEETLKNAETVIIPELENEGWGFPNPESKAHYFTKDRRSLCGKWVYYPDENGKEEPLESEDGIESSDDCPECRDIINKSLIMTK